MTLASCRCNGRPLTASQATWSSWGMNKVILAAIDNSPASPTVVAHAELLAATLDAHVCALHVSETGTAADVELPSWKGAGLYVVQGEPGERLLEVANHPAVLAVVIGCNNLPGACTFGHVCRALAARLAKPLLVVPPAGSPTPTFERMLIPLEGTGETTRPIAALLDDFAPEGAPLEAILLHVFTTDNMPPFADHEPHETDAWVQEFLTRFAPTSDPHRRIVMRVGRREDVSRIADEVCADVVVVSWAQYFAEGHARVIWALLEHPTRPVLLVPGDYRGWREGSDTEGADLLSICR